MTSKTKEMDSSLFQEKLNESVNDDLAYKIVMQQIQCDNGIVAIFGVHEILKKMRAGSFAKYSYCNLWLQRKDDNVRIIDRKTRKQKTFELDLERVI